MFLRLIYGMHKMTVDQQLSVFLRQCIQLHSNIQHVNTGSCVTFPADFLCTAYVQLWQIEKHCIVSVVTVG